MDVEIAEHSRQLMRIDKRIEVAECHGRQEQAVKKDLEYNIIGIQYHLFNARRHCEELKPSFQANRNFFSN